MTPIQRDNLGDSKKVKKDLDSIHSFVDTENSQNKVLHRIAKKKPKSMSKNEENVQYSSQINILPVYKMNESVVN